MCEIPSLCPLSPDELTVYKVQNLQWTADFSGDVTLTWTRPKKMPSASCVYNVYYRWVRPPRGPVSCVESSAVLCREGFRVTPLFLLARVVGESLWKTLETHSNKTNTRLRVLKPDTTYQVKVQVQCLSKVHSTNDILTLRTPEGRKCHCGPLCGVCEAPRGVSVSWGPRWAWGHMPQAKMQGAALSSCLRCWTFIFLKSY